MYLTLKLNIIIDTLQEISQGMHVHRKLFIKTQCLKQKILLETKNIMKSEKKDPEIITWPGHSAPSTLLIPLSHSLFSANAQRLFFPK